jgi:uncharacterized radical SAM superfamily Fe-S cluster-containing enzyme
MAALRKTQSICPECLKKRKLTKLDAEIIEEKGRIYLLKKCKNHGKFKELYSGDSALYNKFMGFFVTGDGVSNPKMSGIDCPNDCGICPRHKTTTILANIDVTNRCNQCCWYCFANSFAAGYVYEPTFEQVKEMLQNLKNQKPVPCQAVQFSGGEPLIHRDILSIIKMAKEMGFSEIQIASNGIELARRPGLAKELREAGLNVVYLKFNGVSKKTAPENYILMPKILEELRKGKLNAVLVPTVIRGFNDHETPEIVKFAMTNVDIIRGVNFQPISFVGRIEKMNEKKRKSERITIQDVILKIEKDLPQIKRISWYPVPFVVPVSRFIAALKNEPKPEFTTHAICGAATYIFIDDEKGIIPITEFIDVEGFMKFIEAETQKLKKMFGKVRVTTSLLQNISKYIDSKKAPKGFNLSNLFVSILTKSNFKSLSKFHYNTLFLGIMHFQDAWNYDIERLERCAIHYAVPDGRIIPFCAYNALPWYRFDIEKRFSVPVKKWEKENRKKIKDDLFTPKMAEEMMKK